MKKIVEMTKELLNYIEEMTDCLYQNKEKEGYVLLNTVIVKMEQVLGEIISYQKVNSLRIVDEEKLLGAVEEAFKAMQEKDSVLIADIFSYDIKEHLELMIETNRMN